MRESEMKRVEKERIGKKKKNSPGKIPGNLCLNLLLFYYKIRY